jgi:hypothetical protein
MQVKDPKPEIMRLEELALMVRNGEIKLPKFQRPFVWKSTDMLKLLDSIYKGYPIGSILIWNSSQKLISERSISGFEVNSANNNNYPTNYLLDGQQRLTTLCGALFWNGSDENSLWNIQFDLDTQEFRHAREKNLVNVFPLNRLIETSDFIRQCMKFDHHAKRDEYFRIAERLLKSIKDYKIAVVKIGDMTIEEVAPIFERINSTGRQLTIVDLMMAATWSNGFDLTSQIHAIREACQEIGFEELSDQIILRSISAAADLGVNKEDIQKLRSKNQEQLRSAADAAKGSLRSALLFLRDYVGIQDFGYIPYTFQLTYLAEFFRISKNPGDEQLRHLTEWFWYTSVTRYFGTSSSTGQVSKDVALMRSFAQGKVRRLFESKEIDISRLLYEKFSLRTAASTTFAMLLHGESPDRTIDGRSIDSSHRKLKSNKLFSSFSPKNGIVEKWNIAKILYPFGEIPDGIENQLDPGAVNGHLLNEKCIEAIAANDVHGFLNQRSEIVAAKVSGLTGCTARYVLPTVFDVNERRQLSDTEDVDEEA